MFSILPQARRFGQLCPGSERAVGLAPSVFQVHGIDAEGKVLFRPQLKRRYVLAFFQKLPSDSPCQPRAVHTRHKAADPGCPLNRRYRVECVAKLDAEWRAGNIRIESTFALASVLE
jgi:hypothetical protein